MLFHLLPSRGQRSIYFHFLRPGRNTVALSAAGRQVFGAWSGRTMQGLVVSACFWCPSYCRMYAMLLLLPDVVWSLMVVCLFRLAGFLVVCPDVVVFFRIRNPSKQVDSTSLLSLSEIPAEDRSKACFFFGEDLMVLMCFEHGIHLPPQEASRGNQKTLKTISPRKQKKTSMGRAVFLYDSFGWSRRSGLLLLLRIDPPRRR